MSYRKIVWLASYPKSGNTWVRLFLDAYFLGEIDINDIVCSVTDDRADRCQIGDGSNISDLPVDIQHLTRPMGLLRLVRAFNKNKFSEVPLFVKTHSAHMIANGIELLPEMLTQATICIVRDPRDVAPSFAKHMGVDVDTAIEYMQDKYRTLTSDPTRVADFMSSWSRHTNSYLNADTHNVRVFSYEAMRQNPVQEFSEILRHSGIEPDEIRVKAALDMVDLGRLRKIEAKEGFRESSPNAKNAFFGEGKVGGNKLTDRQRYRISKAFRRTMERLGYLEKGRGVIKLH